MRRKVEGCQVCDPINNLIDYLENNGFKIIKSKLTDYHFHEVYFKLSGENNIIEIPYIKKIKRHSENEFICECHWSIVELDINK
ncbi:MAG: AraC family transcriptional regulator [Candidatus Lokiarchaeota archaeon]|nr:AraC family transcriptional regulator [Candidatus Lokiarchaeota archaeon]